MSTEIVNPQKEENICTPKVGYVYLHEPQSYGGFDFPFSREQASASTISVCFEGKEQDLKRVSRQQWLASCAGHSQLLTILMQNYGNCLNEAKEPMGMLFRFYASYNYPIDQTSEFTAMMEQKLEKFAQDYGLKWYHAKGYSSNANPQIPMMANTLDFTTPKVSEKRNAAMHEFVKLFSFPKFWSDLIITNME
jgi:hypothetical protein